MFALVLAVDPGCAVTGARETQLAVNASIGSAVTRQQPEAPKRRKSDIPEGVYPSRAVEIPSAESLESDQ